MRVLASYSFAPLAGPVTVINGDGSANVAAFPAANYTGKGYLRFQIRTTAQSLWVKLFKGAVVNATKGTANEIIVTPNEAFNFTLGDDWDGFSIIEEAAGCKGSVLIVD